MSSAVHLIARGRVQGVWFRASTQEQALQMGVCGWARNCLDGSVEIYAEGEKKSLSGLSAGVEKGPPRLRSLAWILSGSTLKA